MHRTENTKNIININRRKYGPIVLKLSIQWYVAGIKNTKTSGISIRTIEATPRYRGLQSSTVINTVQRLLTGSFIEEASSKTIKSTTIMATSVKDVAGLVEGLTIANNAPNVHTQIAGGSSSSSTRPTLQEAIQTLSQSAKITASQAQHVQSLARDTSLFSSLQITETCSLHRRANKLADITRILDNTANTLKNATERSIITHLSSLGGSRLQGILSHFEQQIRSIVQGVLNNSSDDNCVL